MNTKTEQSQQAATQALLHVCEDLRALKTRHASRLANAEADAVEAAIAAQLTPEELHAAKSAEIPLASFLATKRENEREAAAKAFLTLEQVREADDQGMPYSLFLGLSEINARLDALGLSEAAKTCLHIIVSSGTPVDVSEFLNEGEE